MRYGAVAGMRSEAMGAAFLEQIQIFSGPDKQILSRRNGEVDERVDGQLLEETQYTEGRSYGKVGRRRRL